MENRIQQQSEDARCQKQKSTNDQIEYSKKVTLLKTRAEFVIAHLSQNLSANQKKLDVATNQITILEELAVITDDLENRFRALETKYSNEEINFLNTVVENNRLREEASCSICCEQVSILFHIFSRCVIQYGSVSKLTVN